eukprot:213130_1
MLPKSHSWMCNLEKGSQFDLKSDDGTWRVSTIGSIYYKDGADFPTHIRTHDWEYIDPHQFEERIAPLHTFTIYHTSTHYYPNHVFVSAYYRSTSNNEECILSLVSNCKPVIHQHNIITGKNQNILVPQIRAKKK